MSKEKYYNHQAGRFVDWERDLCDWDAWGKEQSSFFFTRHPDGFFVFVPHQDIMNYDEYRDSDPYGVNEELTGEFQEGRFVRTLDLLKLATAASYPRQLRILDIGCGQGYITEKFRQIFEAAEFFALDYSVSAIQAACKKFPKIDFIVANACCLPYTKDFFDIVICNNVWEHIPDPLLLLKEVNRVTKFDGRLIISTPSRYRLSNLAKVLRGRNVGFMSDRHVTEYTVGQVSEQLRHGSFQVEKILGHSPQKKRLVARFARLILAFFLKVIKSHHSIENTVFYLAKKVS